MALKQQRSYQKALKIYVITLVVLGSFLGGLFIGRGTSSNAGVTEIDGETKVLHKYSDRSSEVDFGLFWEVWDKIDSKFILKPINYEKAFHGAIKGLVESLDDPYSVYMDPEETRQFTEQLNGEFGGIGAELTLEDGLPKIVSVIPGTPAQKSGIQVDDIIVRINEEEAFGLSLFESVSKIRGEKGTDVTLGVAREGSDAPLSITVTRDIINVPSVESEIKQDEEGKNILYISINTFADKTFSELENAINANLDQNPEGVILDLRGNSGGLLDQSVLVAGEFMQKDQIVAIQEFSDGAQKEFKTGNGNRLKDLPLIVLVNKGSASASEILAGALRDNRGVKLYGAQTFGKGTVQEFIRLKGDSSLRISIAKWLTPNGTDINKEGLAVDVQVERSREDIEAEQDPQLDKALEDVL